ncbi:MAG: TadE/TadG family type IV pilus assembly protein [Phenylobacterium sp.]
MRINPIEHALTRLKSGVRDERGVTAVLFALAFAILAPVALGVFDIYTASEQRGKLQDALDAAALYAARSSAQTDAAIDDLGDKALAANLQLAGGGTLTASDFHLVGNKIVASATVQLPALTPMLAANPLVSASSEVTRAGYNLEVSLVLDTTGSMSGSRVTDLKAAANSLVDLVVSDAQAPYYSKVAIVPYSMGVNVGSYANAVRGTPTAGTGNNVAGFTSIKFTAQDGTLNQTFNVSNCVSERTGLDAYTDASPSLVTPATLLGYNYPAPGNGCIAAAMMPMSSDKVALHAKIGTLAAGGSTAGHVGIAWGWYLVSPNWGFLFPAASRPAAYGTDHLLKVVVLMTDGAYNSSYCKGVIAQSSTSGSGSTSNHINCNAPNGSAYAQSAQLCTAMKARGVIVYTVGFDLGSDPNATTLVNNCATDAQHVYLPATGASLQTAFQAIGADLNRLRISH